jgi:flagellar protein FlaG
MSIQSLNGFAAGSVPQQPAAPRGEAATAADGSAPVPAAPAQQTAPPDPQQIQNAVEKLKMALPSKANALQFSLDDQTGKTVVRVVDSETGELIRQIPSEELMEIARALDKMQGLLLKQSA